MNELWIKTKRSCAAWNWKFAPTHIDSVGCSDFFARSYTRHRNSQKTASSKKNWKSFKIKIPMLMQITVLKFSTTRIKYENYANWISLARVSRSFHFYIYIWVNMLCLVQASARLGAKSNEFLIASDTIHLSNCCRVAFS